MLETRRSTASGLERTSAPGEGCWLHVIAPTPADLDVIRDFGAPAGLLDHLGDLDERPRVEHEDGCVLVVLQYPAPRAEANGPPWVTLPLSILTTPRGVVTVAHAEPAFLAGALQGKVNGLDTQRATEFVLHLCRLVAEAYLTALRDVDARVDRLEGELRRSLRNEEVLGLLEFQKSLTYFATNLKSNELTLQRYERLPAVRLGDQDQGLLEDARIELRQAIETADIAESVLSDMMDAFASIVSNNLNSVMKVLTSVTILLAVPTLLVSFYGMNVLLPGAHSRWAFAGIVGVCVAVGAVLFVAFRRRNWL